MHKLKVVLIGSGRFGKNHLRVLTKLQDENACELYGVVDTDSDTLKAIKKEYGVRVSTNFRDFLKDSIDAVDVVTPTDTHYAICKEALTAAKHVFVEKPMTTSYQLAKELVQTAHNREKTIVVGHIFRYNRAVQKIKKVIEAGTLGDVYYMFGHFMGLKDPRLDVGALFNFTVHHIDIYNFLLGTSPKEVMCCVGHYLGRPHFEDMAFLALQYPKNTMGFIEGSWLPPGKHRDLTVVGSKGSITCDLLHQKLKLHHTFIEAHNGKLEAIDEGTTELEVKFEEPLKVELQDFINCVKTGQKPLADGESALQVIKVAEKALESARLRRSVDVDENE